MRKLMWMLALFGLVGMLYASAGEGRAARMADGATVSSDDGPEDSGAGEATNGTGVRGGPVSAVRQSILEMRYGQMECKADFVYSTMDSAEEKGNATLSEERSALEVVVAQLNSYVGAGDANSFNHYMSETRNAFADAVSATKRAAMGALQGLTGTERQELRDELRTDYDAAKSTYVECKHAAVVARIEAEAGEVENWSAEAEETADGMEERNYTVDEMRDIIDEAQVEADELETVAGSEEDTDALLEVRKEKWGKIFYLWAQFHKERVNLLLDRFEEKTDGYETEVAEIRSLLDDAASVGDDEIYTLEEAQESKALVSQAMEDFSALVERARGEE